MRRLFSLCLPLLLTAACGDKSDDNAASDEATGSNACGADGDAGDEGASDGGAGDEGAGDGTDGGTDDGTDGTELPEAGAVELTTTDGVTLVADYHPTEAGSPAVVLLHMIPPSWDRSSWPSGFIDALTAEGWTVLNVDRRGAGDSEGAPRAAYQGETAKWDADAAVAWLSSHGHGPIGIIGASNGTTTALDYAVYAAATEGAPAPAWLAFLTGGDYTEAQNPVENAVTVPILYAYSTAERAWSVDQQTHDTGAWAFHEYAEGDHGTKLFDTAHAEELTGHLLAFGRAGFGG